VKEAEAARTKPEAEDQPTVKPVLAASSMVNASPG
jgi:hypothetical protein